MCRKRYTATYEGLATLTRGPVGISTDRAACGGERKVGVGVLVSRAGSVLAGGGIRIRCQAMSSTPQTVMPAGNTAD